MVAVALVVGACGTSDTEAGESAAQEPESTTALSEATTTVPAEDGTNATTVDAASDDEAASPASSGGHATLTLDGETIEFDSFVCHRGAAAVEAFGDDDLTFAALGQKSHDAGTAALAVSSSDSAFGVNYTVFYSPFEDSDTLWQKVGVDTVTIEGDRITSEGDFTKIVDFEHTDESVPGTLEATCGA